MHQAIHIFRKDVRYLRGEIALLLGLALALCWLGPKLPRAGDLGDALDLLVAAAAGFVIARLIHAEPLPGQNQFWVTRPYRWPSLLAAKLLFIVVFICAPIGISQTVILLRAGFEIGSILPGLLWMQVMALVCVALPLAVMAALTASMASYFGCILGVAVLGFAFEWSPSFGFPDTIYWLRDSIVFLTLAILAPVVLYLQYKSRRTVLSRWLALTIAQCGIFTVLLVNWHTLFPIQAALSKEKSGVQLVEDGRRLPPEAMGPVFWADGSSHLNLSFPLTVTGLPEGQRVEMERTSAALDLPDGRTIRLPDARLQSAAESHTVNVFATRYHGYDADPSAWVLTNSQVFPNAESFIGQPFTLRVSIYLTQFGNTRNRTITLQKHPTEVMDGIQCYAGYMNQLECRSAFRWPARIVSQKSGLGKTPLTRLISYSPFPANLELNPIVRQGTLYYPRDPLPDERPVTIEVEEPVAYLHRDLVIRNLKLQDLSPKPSHK